MTESPMRRRAARSRPPGAPTSRTGQAGAGPVTLVALLLGIPLVLALVAAASLALAVVLANDRLPSVDALLDYRPKIPLRVYSADGELLGEFGEERRTYVPVAKIPKLMKDAVVSAEDERFFEHSGIDPWGIARATFDNLTGRGHGGASTITQQVARNFYLSTERSYVRKLFEILLAWRIEETLTKDQILEIYLNHIYLGRRAYGFASAAQIYFGKTLDQLSAAEAAMLAGLPKAPSEYNPVVNPRRAKIRQQYVLGRMRTMGVLDEAQYRAAMSEELAVRTQGIEPALHAPFVAEMARQMVEQLYPTDAYTGGYKVYTTIVADEQRAANASVRQGLLDYDRRQGYRGPEAFVELPRDPAEADEKITKALEAWPEANGLQAAVVFAAGPKLVRVSRGRGNNIDIGPEGLKLAQPALTEKLPTAKRIRPGAIVRIAQVGGRWEIAQRPEVEAAFVAMDSRDGSVRALVGGFDFGRNKFNRVTQAWRQPGSSFKPFVYSAALEKGVTPATLVNDAPLSFDASQTGGQPWEPKNYDGKYEGPMKVRTALAKSKNMVSIRLLQAAGTQFTQDHVARFGFEPERHPPYLTMALGAGTVTPWQMAAAYGVFANGGFRVDPWVVDRIEDSQGRVISRARPQIAGENATRVLDARNAFLTDSLMREVVRSGTGASAGVALKRPDLAGKTGTTNDSHDAWFAGYGGPVVGVSWVGFDQPRKLGDRETGGGLALPIWTRYMERALPKFPVAERAAPEGVVNVDGEWFYAEHQPGAGAIPSIGGGDPSFVDRILQQLF